MNQNVNGYNTNNISNPVQPPKQSNEIHSKNVIQIKDITHYLEIITGNDRVIIDFYADWCKPCHMIKPIFN